jgi:hypothetical protein
MFKSLFRRPQVVPNSAERNWHDPIYGLSKRSLDAWLLLNPQLREQYDAELKTRSAPRPHRAEL